MQGFGPRNATEAFHTVSYPITLANATEDLLPSWLCYETTMSKIQSSPPPFGQQHEDDKEQVRSIIAADVQRNSQTPTPGKLDFTDMSSTPPTNPQAGVTSASAIATEVVVENDVEIEVEPSEELQNFDWEELQEQYHHMIKERGDVEDGLLAEFTELINV
jgi:hypothetical protein